MAIRLTMLRFVAGLVVALRVPIAFMTLGVLPLTALGLRFLLVEPRTATPPPTPGQTYAIIALPCIFILIGLGLLYWMIKPGLPPRNESSGRRLNEGEAPALFELVESIRKTPCGPKVSGIFLTDAVQSSLVTLSKGIIRRRHELVLGVPILVGLSKDGLRSVITHEMAHASLRLPHSAYRIWQIPRFIERYTEAAQNNRLLQSSRLYRMTQNFSPRLSAALLVLSRQHEFACDAASKRCVGARAAGDALLRIHWLSAWNDHHWRRHFEQSVQKNSLPSAPRSQMRQALREQKEDPETLKQFVGELKDRTTTNDTHPWLLERLQAMGWPDDQPVSVLADEDPLSRFEQARPPAIEHPAFDELFRPASTKRISDELDQFWASQLAGCWRMQITENAQAIDLQSPLPPGLVLTPAERRRGAAAALRDRGEIEQARERLRAILDEYP